MISTANPIARRPVSSRSLAIRGGIYFALLSWLLVGYRYGHGNHGQELPPILAMLDSSLYRYDFAIQDFTRPGPRYPYNWAMSAIATITGFGLPVVLLLVKAASQAAFYVGLAFFAVGLLQKAQFTDDVISDVRYRATITFMAICCTLPIHSWGSQILDQRMVPSSVAMAFVAWSLAFGVRGKWLIAFAFSGVAVLFQFLVGFFSVVVLIPAFLYGAVLDNQMTKVFPAAAIVGFPILGIFLVTLGSGSVDDPNFSFLEVFGEFRVPHHWLPSRAAWHQWVSDALLVLATAIALRSVWMNRPVMRQLIVLLGGGVAVSVLGVGLNFVFVEILPITFVGKLQFQRILPFMHVFAYSAFIVLLQTNVCKRHQLIKTTAREVIVVGLLLAPSLSLPLVSLLRGGQLERVALYGLLVIAGLAFVMRQRGIRSVAVVGAASGLFLAGVTPLTPFAQPSHEQILRLHDPLGSRGWAGDSIASWLRDYSSQDDLVLIPPDWTNISDVLALEAQRGMVFSFKNVPYTDAGVWEWALRGERLGGVSFGKNISQGDLRPLWSARSHEEVLGLAREFEACFLVDRTADRQHFPASWIVDADIANEQWALWRLPHCQR